MIFSKLAYFSDSNLEKKARFFQVRYFLGSELWKTDLFFQVSKFPGSESGKTPGIFPSWFQGKNYIWNNWDDISIDAYSLSDEYKEAHNEILWVKIANLRHRLVHDYDDTNWTLICSILFNLLPGFCQNLKSLLWQPQKQANFDPYFDPLQTDMSEYSGIIQCHEHRTTYALNHLSVKRQGHSVASAGIARHEAILPKP